MTKMTEAHEWLGRTLIGSDEEKIGKISAIYLNDETDQPEWATVTSGLFGTKHFLPLTGATPDGEDIHAQVTSQQVKDAPSVDPGGVLAEHEETALIEHYGIRVRTARAGSGRSRL
ncbi:MAG: PRC-barrel domain-containing protein [Solirubrobacteraceae bacterium]